MTLQTKTIVILGPTGSGKTGVAIEIAQQIGGEIISADSRAIYKGLDIGTAKPTREEQSLVPHWGLDLVTPDQRFTVADWKQYAEQKIQEIQERGHIPMVVGGTGLYIDALVYDYQFNQNTGTADRVTQKDDFRLFGIKTPTEELRQRLKLRIDKLFVQDLYDETRRIVTQYGWGSQALKSDIYQFAWQYLQGDLSLNEAKKQCFYDDWHLAKRQITWFKRNPKICWLPLAKIKSHVIKCIQDE